MSEKRGKCIRRQSVATNFARDYWGCCYSFLKGYSKQVIILVGQTKM